MCLRRAIGLNENARNHKGRVSPKKEKVDGRPSRWERGCPASRSDQIHVEEHLVSNPCCAAPCIFLPILIIVWSYRFRQASDFWYLTGFEEPSAAVVLGKPPLQRVCLPPLLTLFYSRGVEKVRYEPGYKMTLFCASKNPKKEIWDGPVAGPEAAKKAFGADEVHTYPPSYLISFAG